MELLRASALTKHFEASGGSGVLKAVDNLDFAVSGNSVLALVGESGCGKSTVARLALNLMKPTSGAILFKGRDIFGMNRAEEKEFRRSVQIIFQDPFASLNPRRNVYETISEPLIIHNLAPKRQLREEVVKIMGKVGLGPDTLGRYPHEFSGGQRQRICIARALAVSPGLIVADEPLSALDVSIQAQILNLLSDLKSGSGISFLFISHDLRVVEYFSDFVGVMYLGKIVEYASSEALFSDPRHPYSRLLLASAPSISPRGEAGPRRAPLSGEVPSPLDIPQGCPFHPRCPERFDPCDKKVPALSGGDGRLAACHLHNPY